MNVNPLTGEVDEDVAPGTDIELVPLNLAHLDEDAIAAIGRDIDILRSLNANLRGEHS